MMDDAQAGLESEIERVEQELKRASKPARKDELKNRLDALKKQHAETYGSTGGMQAQQNRGSWRK